MSLITSGFPVFLLLDFISGISVKCLLKLDPLSPQHELAADGCLIIFGYRFTCINSVNNLTQHPHYISLYSGGEQRGTDRHWPMAVGGK